MKKIFTLIAFVSFYVAQSFGQCVPSQDDTTSLFYPDITQGYPTLVAGQYFEDTVTINVPEDTTVIFATMDIDSALITNITGLPAGIAYACHNTSCSISGGGHGCLNVYGTPAQAGTYTATIYFELYTNGSSSPISNTESFDIVVDTTTGIADVRDGKQNILVYPNPSEDQVNVVFNLSNSDPAQVVIYNLMGAQVFATEKQVQAGLNKVVVNTQNLPAGRYIVVVNSQKEQQVAKLTVVH